MKWGMDSVGTSEFPKRLWPTMVLNSSHSTSKTSAKNGESNSPSPLPTIHRPMGKWSRQTRQSWTSSRSGSRKPRVFGQMSYQVCFGTTIPQLELQLVKLHSHSHTALRWSYLSSVASRPWDTCGSTKTQTENCSSTTSMRLTSYVTSSSPHRILPTEGSSALQQEHHSENIQDWGLSTTPSLPKYQRRRSRQVRPQLRRTLQDHQGRWSRSYKLQAQDRRNIHNCWNATYLKLYHL